MRNVLSAFFVLLLAVSGYALDLSGADYTTPDSWSQHVTSNGFKMQAQEHDFLGGSAALSLTTRFRNFANDYAHDKDIYQYLRMRYSGGELKNGASVSGAVFLRVGTDLDDRDGHHWGSSDYYFYNDTLDVEESDTNGAPRLYQAYLKAEDIAKGTDITFGRIYVDRIDTYHIDGADAQFRFLDDKAAIFAFGGRPVSFYIDTDDDSMYGAGVELQPSDLLKLKAIYTDIDAQDEQYGLYKLRADLTYNGGNAYGEYASVDGDAYYKVGGIYTISKTKTSIKIDYEELLDEIANNEGSYITNPLTYSLFPYGDFKKAKIRISQGITDYLIVGVGTEIKEANGFELDNRDYKRYSAFLDLARFPTENTYISITCDFWDVDKSPYGSSDGSTTFSAQVTQVLDDSIDVWAGTTFERFEYDVEDNDTKDWIRLYYLGGQYRFNDIVSLTGDFSLEQSEILESVSSDLDNNYAVEIWLNLAI